MTVTPLDPRQWLPSGAAVAAMDSHRIVKVSGPDAVALLQGQLSNDVTALAANPGQLSSLNSPKGRVLAVLRVLKHGDDFWLSADAGVFDAFVQRLRMFVLRSKVDIEPDTTLRGRVVAGTELPARFAEAGLPVPGPGEAVTHGECVCLGLPGPVPRVEVYAPEAKLPDIGAPSASADDLARWDILFGLPRILDANRDAHVAQHLNLDELGAISFRKGCYTGQEIIARMKYRGKVKKRTAAFVGDGANVGESLRTEDGKAAGEVVNTAPLKDAQLVLAVVNLDDRQSALAVNGHPLQLLGA